MKYGKIIITILTIALGLGGVTAYTQIEVVKDGCPKDTLCLRPVSE